MTFARHDNLKYKFGNRNFWASAYYDKHDRDKHIDGAGLYLRTR